MLKTILENHKREELKKKLVEKLHKKFGALYEYGPEHDDFWIDEICSELKKQRLEIIKFLKSKATTLSGGSVVVHVDYLDQI